MLYKLQGTSWFPYGAKQEDFNAEKITGKTNVKKLEYQMMIAFYLIARHKCGQEHVKKVAGGQYFEQPVVAASNF
ncbi:hypothetical protein DID88_004496 [Monilinia fructigena]|uniref:Uncharacterized protein n=1 Tax=Monilinia fructigena TaxID=38457 RepID=A0A395IR95_9HELO|nr:hypothetical protein DID88_004496 [Monilinia fructigena]